MAQQSTASKETEAAAERIRQLNEQVLEYGRKAGLSFLEAYETTLQSFADCQDRFADNSQLEPFAALARAQATFMRETARAYAANAREVLDKK
jgi:hypothetical protein